MWLYALTRGVVHNPGILAAFLGMAVAQGIKVPIFYLTNRKWDFRKLLSTGGMPSSHSATVSALSTVVGIRSGPNSLLFAACTVFAVIVMYDAAGIRRHAGEQAVALNNLAADIGKYIDRHFMGEDHVVYEKRLKEMLGHQPMEVFMGCLLGIAIGTLAATWLPGPPIR